MNEPKRSLADLFAGQAGRRRAEDEERPDFSAGVAALFDRIAAESSRGADDDAFAGGHVDSLPPTGMRRERRAVETTSVVEPVLGAPGPASVPPTREVEAKPAPGRPRFRGPTLWLTVTAAVLALAVIVAIAMLWGLNRDAPIADDAALRELKTAETSLADTRADLDDAQSRIEEMKAGALDIIGRADAAITGAADVSDEAARAAAAGASASYRSGVDGITLPTRPEPHEPGDLDTDSAAAIAAELDEVREQQEILDALAADLERSEQELQGLTEDFTAAWSAFLASFPAHATVVVEENPDAEEAFRAAVTAAGAAVAAATGDGLAGEAEMQAYAAAVTALRADQARAAEEAREGQQEVVTPPTPVEPVPVPTVPPAEPTPEPTSDPPTP